MDQPMDFNEMMQEWILGVTTRFARLVKLNLILTFNPWERDRMRNALNHEPTQDDWDDYSQFWGELQLDPRSLQRSIDREKIRRLVFSKDYLPTGQAGRIAHTVEKRVG